MLIDSDDLDKIKDLNLIQSHNKKSNTIYIKSVIYQKSEYIKTIHIHRLIMGLGDWNEDPAKNNLSINRLNSNLGSIIFENDPKRKKKYRFLMNINKKTHRKRFMTWNQANEYRVKYLREVYGDDLIDNKLQLRLVNQIEKEVPKDNSITLCFD